MNSLLENSYDLSGSQSSKWIVVLEHVKKLLDLKADWDGEGAAPIREDLIRSAYQLATQIQNDGECPPHDVYPLSEGTIILEWQSRDKVIVRIEVEEVGKGERMITYPDRPAEFFPISWSAAEAPYRGTSAYFEIAQVTIRISESESIASFGDQFQLAA